MNKYFFLGIQIVRELHIVIGCSHTKNDFFLHRDQKSKMSTATVFILVFSTGSYWKINKSPFIETTKGQSSERYRLCGPLVSC
jgi:hypothetical protein